MQLHVDIRRRYEYFRILIQIISNPYFLFRYVKFDRMERLQCAQYCRRTQVPMVKSIPSFCLYIYNITISFFVLRCMSRAYISWTTDYLVFAFMLATYIFCLYRRQNYPLSVRIISPIATYFGTSIVVGLLFKIFTGYPYFIF